MMGKFVYKRKRNKFVCVQLVKIFEIFFKQFYVYQDQILLDLG